MSPGKRVRVADVVRRRRTPRLDAVSVLALVIPLLTVGVLALVRQPPVHDADPATRAHPAHQRHRGLPRPGAGLARRRGCRPASGASGDVTVNSDGEKSSVAGQHRRV